MLKNTTVLISFILIYITIFIYYVNRYWKRRRSIWNLKEEPISLKSYECPFSWCNIAFYFLSTRKTGKTSICRKQVRWLITSQYLLVRITLNKLEERDRQSSGRFPFRISCLILFNHGQSAIFQSPGTNYSNLNVWLEKIIVLPSISPVIRDMMKSIVFSLVTLKL